MDGPLYLVVFGELVGKTMQCEIKGLFQIFRLANRDERVRWQRSYAQGAVMSGRM